MSHPIVAMIEKGLELDYEREQAEHPREPGLHVSHVTKCERQVYFDLIDAPKSNPLTTDSLINFAVGRAVEDAFTAKLAACGATIVREAVVEIPVGDKKVTGHIDALAVFLDEHMVIEIKSTSSIRMKYMPATGQEDHRRQLHLYMHASHLGLLDHVFGQEVRFNTGYLTYVVKNATKGQQLIYPYDVHYDEHLANNDLVIMSAIAEFADTQIDPGIPADMQRNKFPCSYCSYEAMCWNGGMKRSAR